MPSCAASGVASTSTAASVLSETGSVGDACFAQPHRSSAARMQIANSFFMSFTPPFFGAFQPGSYAMLLPVYHI